MALTTAALAARYRNLDELHNAILVRALPSDADWSDLPRRPTQLEIMAACCAIERRGDLRFDFIGGLLHISSPCA